ncbi:hypothetical protein TRFO_10408 [Tritrichomonas foetus]|uniref:Ras-GAP domain-containing protein n=1 Tax=Tritrichomonas foetus TaxID=1144522 RepID=A0A1J4JDL8_9EUKA|nr:hypothetical protein TRFO_10408 [Tritrichomonas foetus]|eukprot:OHS95533.1 hypothetical protein TRFO_10408 [Tritrichomonas foetus]
MTNPNPAPVSQTPSDIMVFTLNLSQAANSPITPPHDADEKWASIAGPEEFISYTKLINHIGQCTNPSAVIDAFDPDSPQLDFVTSELSRHLGYLHKILKVNQFLQFTSQMRIDNETLTNILQPHQIALFTCTLHLLNKILSVIPDYNKQQQILLSFSEYLIPEELKKARKARPYIKTILYMPAKLINEEQKVWLLVNRDFNTISIFNFNDPETPRKVITLDQFIQDIYAEQLVFSSVMQPGTPVMSFCLITPNAGRTWIDAFSNKETDPLLTFLSSLPHIVDDIDKIPNDFKKQLSDIITAPDLDLARAICTVAANEFRDGEHTKNACMAVLSLLNTAGYLTQFVRCGFAEAISDTTDTTNILRMSSIASMSSGLILKQTDNDFAKTFAEAIKNDNGNLTDVVNHFMQLGGGFTPPMKFVLSAAFRSSRRKFPEYLVPLNAISSIFMLRYLATELTSISMDLAKLCQTLTLTLMFSTKVEQLPDELYPQMALFLVNLTHLTNSSITLPPFNINDLIIFLKYSKENNFYFHQIVTKLSDILKKPQHPMVWSVVELFENIYNGTDENFKTEMEGKTFLPARYVRKQAPSYE